MALRMRAIVLVASGVAIAVGISIGVAWVGFNLLGMYLLSHAHDHREFADPAPTLVGVRVDDGRLTIHLNLCGETLEQVRIVSWEASPEPLPIWYGSRPRRPLAEPGTFRLDEAGSFGQVSGELPRRDASLLWVEISTKQNEDYASTGQFAVASIPAALPPGVYWMGEDTEPRTAAQVDAAARCEYSR